MKASDYVTKHTTGTVLADKHARIFNNLSLAGVFPGTQVTTANKSAIDSLLERLEKKIGTQITAKKPAKTVSEEEKRGALTYTESLLAGDDPDTGEKLSVVSLLGGHKALHNPSTRVVYPVPANKNLPKRI